MLKLAVDVNLSTITKIINLLLRSSRFANDLKSADVSPIFKEKKNNLEKENYRDLSVFYFTCQRSLGE